MDETIRREGYFIKSYNGLYEQMISDENILLAIKRAAKNKRKNNRRHKRLRHIRDNAERYIETVRQWIINFEPPHHVYKQINDGISAKKRIIIVPTVEELIVHHAMINVLRPVLTPPMYEHSYGSIPGKGLHRGVRMVQKWLKADRYETTYCYKLDIKRFFQSVDQMVLLRKLKKHIRDDKFFSYVIKVVKTVPQGLPLGFITSQWFANYYLTSLDHYIKENLKIHYMIRFVDDIVMFHHDKTRLHAVRKAINNYMYRYLNIQVKENWQVFRVADNNTRHYKGRMIDFLGFKFYRRHTGFRSSIALAIQRKAKRIHKKPKANVKDARQIVTYSGFTKYANVHNWYTSHVAPCVDISHMRRLISAYDRANYNERMIRYAQITSYDLSRAQEAG